jgi:hypothetical protein
MSSPLRVGSGGWELRIDRAKALKSVFEARVIIGRTADGRDLPFEPIGVLS